MVRGLEGAVVDGENTPATVVVEDTGKGSDSTVASSALSAHESAMHSS